MKRLLLVALLVCVLIAPAVALAFQRRECASTPPNRLIVRERGRVSDDDPSPLNVREGPNTSYDPPIGQIPVGVFFTCWKDRNAARAIRGIGWNTGATRAICWSAGATRAMPTFTLWRPIHRGNEIP
jgi:hypothetical protein